MNGVHSLFSRLFHSLSPHRAAVTLVVLLALVWSSPASCDAIHDAAGKGDLGKVKTLLKDNPALVFSKDKDGWSPLHWAAAKGHKDVAELLLANHADVNAKKDDGLTPLHLAAFNGWKDVAELLLANKADANAKASGSVSPLQYAAAKGHKDVVELLLANHADVNAKDNAGLTPLHWAACNGQKDVVELLLSYHAEVNPEDNDGDTPLHLAAETGHNDVAELLRREGGQDRTSLPTTLLATLRDGSACRSQGGQHVTCLEPGVRFEGVTIKLYYIDEKGPKEFGTKKGLDGSFNSKKDGAFKVDLAPGQHTLTVLYSQFFFNVHATALDANVSFVAKAGHSYKVCYIDLSHYPDAYGLPLPRPSPVLNNRLAGVIPSRVALVVVDVTDNDSKKIVSQN